jgi:hypothetical protein
MNCPFLLLSADCDHGSENPYFGTIQHAGLQQNGGPRSRSAYDSLAAR